MSESTKRDGGEELRDDINRCITNYPKLKISETLGVLVLVQAELLERLRTSGAQNDRTP